MRGDDLTEAAAASKRSAAMLRDARLVLRRLELLLATAQATVEPCAAELSEARDALKRVVAQLTIQDTTHRRHTRELVRHLARPPSG